VVDRRGEAVLGLSADDFAVLEDGRPQEITYFARGDAATPVRPELHLGLLLDYSESMQDEMAFTRTAAVKFLNTLTDAVDVTLVDFDTEVRAARYAQADYVRVIERIRQQKVRGMTALYDAIGTYLDGAAALDGRKVMLVYTDGGDTTSALGRGELMDLLKASDVTVYAIGSASGGSGPPRTAQDQLLRQIAALTGGQAFFPQSLKELDAVYARVVREIRAQYTLGYTSTNAAPDGRWRTIQVRLVSPDAKERRVRTRPGYFAPLRRQP
jgi:VWFA-related protein